MIELRTGTWVGHIHGHETPQRLLKELSIPKKAQLDNMLNVLKDIDGKSKFNDFPIINPFTHDNSVMIIMSSFYSLLLRYRKILSMYVIVL